MMFLSKKKCEIITMKYGDERKQKATTSSGLRTVMMFIHIHTHVVFTHVAQQ